MHCTRVIGFLKENRETEAGAATNRGNPRALRSASKHPSHRRLIDRSGYDRGTFVIGARPDSVTWCGHTVPDGVSQRGEAAMSASAHRIGTGAIEQ
jgi:hypothetical protein